MKEEDVKKQVRNKLPYPHVEAPGLKPSSHPPPEGKRLSSFVVALNGTVGRRTSEGITHQLANKVHTAWP